MIGMPVAHSTIGMKMSEMGASPGCMITVENTEDTSGGMDIKVKGYHLRLSKEDAELITVVHLGI